MSVTVLHGNQALMAGSPWEMATVIDSARLCILRLWEKVNQTEHHAFLKPKGITWSEARCVIKKSISYSSVPFTLHNRNPRKASIIN